MCLCVLAAGVLMCWSTGYLVLVVLLCALTSGHAQTGGTISFAQEVLTTEEGTGTLTPIQIPLVRDGDTTGAVVVSLSVSLIAIGVVKCVVC